ncbi:MAG TPA: 3-dehydroquinate synthase [Bacillota bacterium]|nr:3-dehydroquinate synthase [Bacillota bacterium]HOL12343.1 3-dehydroquinate synthase [Bacillota bacterium]HPP61266.1 3-dehydroquinate synthase [Bacillota bacterium]
MGTNIILCGPMACGKTSIGRLVATALDMPFVDTDTLIETEVGKSISQIFSEQGETYFRTMEKAILEKVFALKNTVIALGGGALIDPENITGAKKSGILIGLTATPSEIMRRTANDRSRPLLACVDETENIHRIENLLDQRLPGLKSCDLVLDTTNLTPDEICIYVLAHLSDCHNITQTGSRRNSNPHCVPVNTNSGNGYNVLIGQNLFDKSATTLRSLFERLGYSQEAVIITNPLVNQLYADKLVDSMLHTGIEPAVVVVPDGEDAKSLETASYIYNSLAAKNVTRDTPMLALGGGVVGDLAGFAASTYMRGVPLVQIPTTLLAQVDSSIGGKVAVNHCGVKNLIGSFYNPVLVISDTSTLSSLPDRDYIEGLGEVVKYGIAMDREFFFFIRNNVGPILKRDMETLEYLVRRSCEIKSKIVKEDPWEKGPRMILNFGHTLGHAIEAASGYGALRHGEAVSIGMALSMSISVDIGIMGTDEMSMAIKLLKDLGLPTRTDLTFSSLYPFLQSDKKSGHGKKRFVLCEGLGKAMIADDLDLKLIIKALEKQQI